MMKYLLPLLLAIASTTYASMPIEAFLDRNDTTLGEPLSLKVKVSQSLDENLSLPSIDGVSVTSSGSSTNMSWINGNYTKEIIYTFQLEPQKAGQLTIPPITAKINGQVYKTPPIAFNVRKASDTVASDPGTPSGIFLKRQCTKTTLYVGEPFVCTIKLYHRLEIAKADVISENSPQFRYFDLGQNQGQEQVSGVLYNVIILRQGLLTNHPGQIKLPPFQVRVALVVQDRRGGGDPTEDLFSEFFNNFRKKVVQKTLASTEETLTVKDFPQENVPANFQGLVGNFNIQGDIRPRDLKQGDSATLTLTIEGNGVLDPLGKLSLDLGKNIKLYPDKPDVKEFPDPNTGVNSRRIYKYAIVPTQGGKLELPDVTIPYFNFATGEYKLLKYSPGSLNVEAVQDANDKVVFANNDSGSESFTVQKSKVEKKAQDIIDLNRHWEDLSPSVLTQEDGMKLSLIGGIPFLLFFASFGFQTLLPLIQGRKGRRREKAYKKLREMLNQKDLSPGQSVLTGIYKAYCEYVGEAFGVKGGALTTKEIQGFLETKGLDPQVLQKNKQLADYIEKITYAENTKHSLGLTDFKEGILSLASEIEKKC